MMKNTKKGEVQSCEARHGATVWLRVMLVGVMLLTLVNASLLGVVYAKYRTSAGDGDEAEVARFAPVIYYGDEWNQAASLSGAVLAQPTVLPFTVSNINTEVRTRASVRVERDKSLPLDYALEYEDENGLYAVAALDAEASTDTVLVYRIEMAPGTELVCRLRVAWRAGVAYNELYIGMTEGMRLTVTCEQI